MDGFIGAGTLPGIWKWRDRCGNGDKTQSDFLGKEINITSFKCRLLRPDICKKELKNSS